MRLKLLIVCSVLAAGASSLMGQSPNGRTGTLVVLNKSVATATFIDVASGETLATLPTGRGPHELAITRDGRWYLEQYCMTVQVEANLTVEMAKTMIVPAAIRYQNELASTVANLRAAGVEGDTTLLEEVSGLVKSLQGGISALEASMSEGESDQLGEEALHACPSVLPAMSAVRESADALEGVVADDLWPLPTYQEMLFIR